MADLSQTHPLYDKYNPEWTKLDDCYEGEKRVKSKNETYLPPTEGQLMRSGNASTGLLAASGPGRQAYDAYKLRARFPELISLAVEGFVGVMHRKPAEITLPAELEPLRANAAVTGESLQHLLRQINAEQFLLGRIGLLADTQPEGIPKLAWYRAPSIINWNTNNGVSQLIVLDESGLEMNIDTLEWDTVDRWRVLALQDGVYRQGEFTVKEATLNELSTPLQTGRSLDYIPFHFINSDSRLADPSKPPLLGIADLSLAIYRSEADYRHALYMTGQDTLVIKGALDDPDKPVEIGSQAFIHIQDTEGDAKYVGVQGTGLSEMRSALDSDRMHAANRVGTLLDNNSHERESGDALAIRVAAKTASLGQIALTGAEGLERALKDIAVWVGADPEEVSVVPNTDFTLDGKVGQEMLSIMQAVALGFPLSDESLHELAKKRELTSLSWEDEKARGLAKPAQDLNTQQAARA